MRRSDKIKDRVLVKSYFNAPEKASTEQQAAFQKREPFLIRIFSEDKKLIRSNAAKSHLSMSEYIRRVATGTKLPNAGNAHMVLKLYEINADMARLGNLLKMMLSDEVSELEMVEGTLDIETLIRNIEDTRAIIKAKALEL